MRDLTARIARLSPTKRSLLMLQLRLQKWESAAGAESDDARLVGYVVPEPGMIEPDPAELRSFLQKRLPDFMIPPAFVILDNLPRNAHGKVDRRALPAPDLEASALGATFVEARTPTEQTLVDIWSEVLGLELVGIHDNFFEIGGDSILSIQIISRARQAGLRLSPHQLFQHATIAELAAIVQTDVQHFADQGPITGPLELTPIQHWFFEQPLPEPHHWNQSLWLEAAVGVDPACLEKALGDVVRQHDALRLCFVRDEFGWRAFHAAPEKPVPFTRIDLSRVPPVEQEAAAEEAAARLQAGLNLAEGRLVRTALFAFGGSRPDRLLISIHHLVVDLLSWQILLDDLETAYAQHSRGEVVHLPLKTSSFKTWSDALATHARSKEIVDEAAFWLSLSDTGASSLPRDDTGAFTESSAHTLTSALSVNATQSLLQHVPAAYNTQADDVLLTALVLSFARWTGESSLLVGLERHGREEIADGLDLSRTVGWFTTFFPIRLSLDSPSSDIGAALRSIKEQLRRIPRNGIGYGLLRYLRRDRDTSEQLQALPQPEILFNYAGRAGAPTPANDFFRPLRPIGISRGPSNCRKHLLEVTAFIEENRLKVNWTYSDNVHHHETLERLSRNYMETLQSLISHCLSPGAGGYTPSDFPEAELDQDELDRFIGKLFA